MNKPPNNPVVVRSPQNRIWQWKLWWKKDKNNPNKKTEAVSCARAKTVVSSATMEGSAMVKCRRERLLEEARNRVSENGSWWSDALVKAFERLLSIPKEKDSKGERGRRRRNNFIKIKENDKKNKV
ncbi:protein tpx2 [Sesbania bispinosa]|nr:protein tpx2 [Sesbania bispinosa]